MQIIGHRGACGYKAENTLASFQEALALGADMIELDVHVQKSGEVVVFHDFVLDRTTDGTGRVEDYTFRQLRKLNAGDGQKIPLLTEVLDLVDKRVPINIELKGNGTAKPVAAIIKYYVRKRGWSNNLFLVSSLKVDELKVFAQICPKVNVSLVFRGKNIDYAALAGYSSAFSLNLKAEAITHRNVAAIHSQNLKVFAYTVNTKPQAQLMTRLKVDGIFTNYPDRVRLSASV